MPVISLCWPSEISRPGQKTRGVNPCKACVGLSDGGKQGLPKAVFFLHQLSAASPGTRAQLRVMPCIAGCSKTSLGARQLKMLGAPAWAASWDPLKKGKKKPQNKSSASYFLGRHAGCSQSNAFVWPLAAAHPVRLKGREWPCYHATSGTAGTLCAQQRKLGRRSRH